MMNFFTKLTLVANFISLNKDFETCLQDFNEKIPNINKKYEELSQELIQLQNKCNNLKAAIDNLQNKKSSLEKDLNTLNDQKKVLLKASSFQSNNQFYQFIKEHNYELVPLRLSFNNCHENELKMEIQKHIMQFCTAEFLDFQIILEALNQINSFWFKNLKEYTKNKSNNPMIYFHHPLGCNLLTSYYVLSKIQ